MYLKCIVIGNFKNKLNKIETFFIDYLFGCFFYLFILFSYF